MIRLLFVSVIFCMSFVVAAVDFSPKYTTIKVGGKDRKFGYYVPASYDKKNPTPLLFMFHGLGGNISEKSGGSAENSYYGWQTTAHKNGFIVLFPDSLQGKFGKHWDIPMNGRGKSKDLKFIDALLKWSKKNYNISKTQIFTTGHS